MRKLSFKGRMQAYIILTIFTGVIISVMALGSAAYYKIEKQTTIKEIINVKPIKVDVAEPIIISQVNDLPELDDVPAVIITVAQVKVKEVIHCTVINGVKHFSNEFVKEVA